MPTPADQRLTDLLDRWLTSLDLHIKYSSLDDDSYWQVQPWVEHQRPARWILDLAREKTAALRAEIGARSAAGDAGFADALEQMMFLANLVGLQHIERFIPVAEPQNERSTPGAAATAATTAMSATTGSTGTREMPQLQTLSVAATGTREMPRLATPKAPPAPGQLVARAERKGGTQSRAAGAAKSPSRKAAAASDAGRRQVMNDAVRLLQWGRRWFELAELIARMADRPPPHEVRRILDENRAAIEASALDTRT